MCVQIGNITDYPVNTRSLFTGKFDETDFNKKYF